METARQPAITVPFSERDRRARVVSMKPKHKVESNKSAKLRERIQNESDLRELDLSNLDLSGLDLSYKNFTGSNLQGVSLRGSHLEKTDLTDVCLRGG